jgi:hypothetical protein
MVWSLIGLGLSMVVAAAAWRRSRGRGGFYDAGVYGMTSTSHRSYALASLAFAAFFVAMLALRQDSAGVAGLALYAVIAAFYATSFLRGAGDDDD